MPRCFVGTQHDSYWICLGNAHLWKSAWKSGGSCVTRRKSSGIVVRKTWRGQEADQVDRGFDGSWSRPDGVDVYLLMGNDGESSYGSVWSVRERDTVHRHHVA